MPQQTGIFRRVFNVTKNITKYNSRHTIYKCDAIKEDTYNVEKPLVRGIQ